MAHCFSNYYFFCAQTE